MTSRLDATVPEKVIASKPVVRVVRVGRQRTCITGRYVDVTIECSECGIDTSRVDLDDDFTSAKLVGLGRLVALAHKSLH